MKNHYQSCLRRVLACLAACVVLSPLGLRAEKGDPFTVKIGSLYYQGTEGYPGVYADVTNESQSSSGLILGNVTVPPSITYKSQPYAVEGVSIGEAQISRLVLPASLPYDERFSIGHGIVDELVIPEGVTQIPAYMLEDLNIGKLYLPSTLKKIQWYYVPLNDRINIKSIHVPNIAVWCNLDCNDDDPEWVSVKFLDGGVELYVNGTLIRDLVVPNGVSKIMPGVFYGYDFLESVTLSDDVKEIGYSAFQKCVNLKEIDFGSGVEKIGKYAFWEIPLKNIVIPAEVDTLETQIYGSYNNFHYFNGIESLVVEDGDKDVVPTLFCVRESAKYVYCGRNFIEPDLSEYNDYRWWGISGGFPSLWGTETLEIGEKVSDITGFYLLWSGVDNIISHAVNPPVLNEYVGEEHDFMDSPIYESTTVSVPPLCKYKYANAPIWENFFKRGRTAFKARNMNFYGDAGSSEASLTFGDEDYEGHLVIPDEVVYDGDEVVYSVTSVGSHSFAGCGKLRAVTVPASVTAIENDAFTECVALDSIVLMSAVPPKCDVRSFKRVAVSVARVAEDDVDNIFANTTLYVPAGSVTAYRNADGWGEFANIQEQKAVTSLDEVGVSTPRVMISGYGIVIDNGDGCPVEVYSIDGQLLNRSLSYGGERIALPKGTYIVKVGAAAMKVSL